MLKSKSISGHWVRKNAYISDSSTPNNYVPDGIATSLGYSHESVIELPWRFIGRDQYLVSKFHVQSNVWKGLILLGDTSRVFLARQESK